jgi:serine/threonine protein kinase
MASLLQIGDYRNESERWAAEFLRDQLPPNYEVYSNFYVAYNGMNYEVDLLVVSPYAVTLIDSKGYEGAIRAAQDVWTDSNGNTIPMDQNPLDKVRRHADMLRDEWRSKYQSGDMPFFHASVFVTGRDGENIRLTVEGQKLNIFDPKGMIDFLTAKPQCQYPRMVTADDQKKLSQMLGFWYRSRKKPINTLRDFQVGSIPAGSQISLILKAVYKMGSFEQPVDLHIRKLAQLKNVVDVENAKKELHQLWRLCDKLSGIAIAPQAFSPFFEPDGNYYVLPMRHREGVIFDLFLKNSTSYTDRIEFFERLTDGIAKMHRLGIKHGNLWQSGLLVEGCCPWIVSLPVTPIDDGETNDLRDIAKIGCALFGGWAIGTELNCNTIQFEKSALARFKLLPCFCVQQLAPSIDTVEQEVGLKELISAEISVDKKSPIFRPESGVVINEHFKLIDLVGLGQTAEVWKAVDIISEMECSIKLMVTTEEEFSLLRKEYGMLSRLLHPNIVRTFFIDWVENSDYCYMVNEYGERSIDDLLRIKETVDAQIVKSWFAGCLSALQYLRNQKKGVIVHKDIKPANIVVTGDKASLIDFGITDTDADVTAVGTLKYRIPHFNEWSWEADLYALCLSFFEFLHGEYPFADETPIFQTGLDTASCQIIGFSKGVFARICKVLAGEFPALTDDLASWFMLQRMKITLDHPLPASLMEKWKINGRIQPYLVGQLILCEGKATKDQLIRKTLNWRKMNVNHNWNSQSASLSGLRDLGVLDYLKGKSKGRIYVTLTEEFKESMEELQ